MKLLLDTHVLLWAVLEPAKLSELQRAALEESSTQLLVSAASAWEIATKWRLGKLNHAAAVVHNYTQALNGLAAHEIPISGDVARRAGLLDVEHRDPFDRLLAAQAMTSDLVLASQDPVFSGFPELELLR
ncbi:MAG: type II toxin-antitoxin system VapC family toxin [Prochlorococcaceae cyanobacterium]|jgi:PIN domain nuclease of toxin-antitoxin system